MAKKYKDGDVRLTYWPIGVLSYDTNYTQLRYYAIEIDRHHPLLKKLLWWMENAQITRLVKK